MITFMTKAPQWNVIIDYIIVIGQAAWLLQDVKMV